MLHTEINPFGAISVDRAVIDGWIDQIFKKTADRAWLAHYKGGVSDVMIRIGNFDALAEKVVEMTDRGLYIRLYIILRFGCSISETSAEIMDRLAYYLTEYLELPIDNIEIVVTGVASKNIAKRHVVTDYRSLLNSRAGIR